MSKISRQINNSYQRIHRNRHALALKYKLNAQEYRLWDLLFAVEDWDKKHIDTYHTIKATGEELATFLGGCNPSTVSRTINGLIDKGFVEQVGRSTYKLLVRPDTKDAGLQESPARLQTKIARTPGKIAPTQENQPRDYNIPLVSYKDNSRLVDEEEQYGNIKHTSKLSTDDIDFINKDIERRGLV